MVEDKQVESGDQAQVQAQEVKDSSSGKMVVTLKWPINRFYLNKDKYLDMDSPVEMSQSDAEKAKAEADRRGVRLRVERKK